MPYENDFSFLVDHFTEVLRETNLKVIVTNLADTEGISLESINIKDFI